VAYLAGDQQGTDSAAVDAASLNLTRRYYDPYGNTRGTTAPAFPAGEKGFVGGINDTATGLTDLGVREYQPGTGSFISPDPLIKPFEPTGLDPYSYAQGNPTTYSDPTGAFPCAPGDYCGPNGPKYYTGAHGCAGQSQAAVDACVKAWDNAHKKSQPRGTGGNGPVIVNSVAGSPWASIMGSMGFSAALGQLANYFRRYGQAENGQFTAIVSEVEVKTPAGSIEPRIVVIVSQKGLPPELQELFSNEHIAIVRATPREGHAEIAAREFRRNPARQLKALGGKIIRVNAAVWNNRACSDECAEAGTEYIGDPGVTIRKGGRGFIRTRLGGVEIFSVKNISKWWSRLGGRSALEVIERWNYTGGGAGREIGDIEDE
jgi:RHS repeat-associated protein